MVSGVSLALQTLPTQFTIYYSPFPIHNGLFRTRRHPWGQTVRDIRKVAVLGAGTMGARIAAHLANAFIPSVLLDVVPRELTPEEQAKGLTLSDARVRNRLAQAGLEAALKARPAAFFVPEAARMIVPGNFEDNLTWLKDCDWIIEAVTEDRSIKRNLLEKVMAVRKPGAMVSSNTSGIGIASILEGFNAELQQHFLGTHFFNPPRYLKLLEVIPTPETLPEVVEAVSRFAEVVLGKGIVVAKDTPNFIANRIGTFITLKVLRVMQEDGYTIEEIDALTGPAMACPSPPPSEPSISSAWTSWRTSSRTSLRPCPMMRSTTSSGFPILSGRWCSGCCWGRRPDKGFTRK